MNTFVYCYVIGELGSTWLDTTENRGSTAGVGSSTMIPVGRLRDVLSDAGLPLGAEDATRLETVVRRRIMDDRGE